MVEELKKMKKLLLIPACGVIIVRHLQSNLMKNKSLKVKYWSLAYLLMGLTFVISMLGMIFLTALLAVFVLNIDNNEFLVYAILIISAIISSYLMAIPCLIYINYLIRLNSSHGESLIIK